MYPKPSQFGVGFRGAFTRSIPGDLGFQLPILAIPAILAISCPYPSTRIPKHLTSIIPEASQSPIPDPRSSVLIRGKVFGSRSPGGYLGFQLRILAIPAILAISSPDPSHGIHPFHLSISPDRYKTMKINGLC
jgi:hypothetical protein